MAQMKLPAEPKYQRTSYSKLLGADFSIDPALVDSRHSPDILNMISDNGGNPVKRKGWEIIYRHPSAYEATNIWTFTVDKKRFFVVTFGDRAGSHGYHTVVSVFDENGEKRDIYTTLTQSDEMDIGYTSRRLYGFYTEVNSTQFGFYILSATGYYRIYLDTADLDSENRPKIKWSKVSPYVPTTIISRLPTGGGYQFDAINMLTSERIESFLNTTDSLTFKVTSEVDTAKAWSIKYMDAGGEWQTAGSKAQPNGCSVSGDTFTVVNTYSVVTTGVDNVRIQYFSTTADKSAEILTAQVGARFSTTAQDQIFISGGQNKNYVYYSQPNDVTYWPDLNYMIIGGETEIVGFLNLGEYLAVVKQETAYDSTIFMVYQTSISSTSQSVTDINTGITTTKTVTERTYAAKRASTGIGAISNRAFGVLNDEPIFLSRNGVYGIVSENVTSEKIVRNRSAYIDSKLTKEASLANAVSCVWNNYYIVVVNRHAYVLDGRHKGGDQRGNTNYLYEAYYWENIPADCITAYSDGIWFGDAGGFLCRFKMADDIKSYSDATVLGDDTVEGTAIVARWSTPDDNDGLSEYFKTMQKKGTMCTVAPYQRSSVKVYISPDGYPRIYIGYFLVDVSGLFDGVIDFGRLSFDPRTTPRDSFFRRKQKKYQRLRIILENDALNEPFGVYEIVKTYVVTRFAKNRSFVPQSGNPTTPIPMATHTITVEIDEDESKSMSISGTEWKDD